MPEQRSIVSETPGLLIIRDGRLHVTYGLSCTISEVDALDGSRSLVSTSHLPPETKSDSETNLTHLIVGPSRSTFSASSLELKVDRTVTRTVLSLVYW